MNCLTWDQIISELPGVIFTVLCLGGIIGGSFVSLMKKRHEKN